MAESHENPHRSPRARVTAVIVNRRTGYLPDALTRGDPLPSEPASRRGQFDARRLYNMQKTVGHGAKSAYQSDAQLQTLTASPPNLTILTIGAQNA